LLALAALRLHRPLVVMALVEIALPTLLCSRPRISEEPLKLQRRRPAPVALEAADEEDVSPLGLRIKNTFIEGASCRSPSLERFYPERAALTCPSQHIGCLASIFGESAAAPSASPSAPPPPGIPTPCALQTPLADSLSQLPGGLLPGLGMQPNILPGAAPSQVPFFHAALAATAPLPSAPSLAPPQAAAPRMQRRTVLNLSDALLMQETPAHYSDFLSTPVVGASADLLAAGGGKVSETLVGSLARPVPPAPLERVSPSLEPQRQPPTPPAGPAPGSPELPSLGSAGHAVGACKPCAFLHTKGCTNGLACQFCHLCGRDEIKRRRHEKVQLRKEANRARIEMEVAAVSLGFAVPASTL